MPLECYVVNEDSEQIPFDVLELEFFDAESIVIVGRTHEEQSRFRSLLCFTTHITK